MKKRRGSADGTTVKIRWCAVVAGVIAVTTPTSASAAPPDPVRVLVIAAHPDDETLFNLGRFAERGWHTSVALVTNGEGGQVVESIRKDYDPTHDEDVLVESPPGPFTWVVKPPAGPRTRLIPTPTALARERRREFIETMSIHRVQSVFLLSSLRDPDFEDNWDRGVSQWNKRRLRAELRRVAKRTRPDVVVTLNPGESWAHPAHVGLGRWVDTWRDAGVFDSDHRPALYGLREHAWYEQSMAAQTGDLTFSRTTHSRVLGSTYERYWHKATSTYVSQSSHPVWLQARADAGILPGYHGIDVIRRLSGRSLTWWMNQQPPEPQAYRHLPRHPKITHVR